MTDYEKVRYDVLVIGSGGAGLRAAIAAAERKATVAIASKSLLGKAHTVMAEGGMAAALKNVDAEDSWECHFADIMKSGQFLNDWRMAEIFARDMPERAFELESWGAVFDRTPAGKISQRAFGGHTFRRVCHIGDRTGLEMLRTLQDRLMESNVDFYHDLAITRLLKRDGRIAGAFGYRSNRGTFIHFQTKAVILASGGLGRIFKITSNSWESTGDGFSLAYEAGADLRDMEMMQFHPTGMVHPESAKGLLVTEGVRGEGGLLFNSKGERFMEKVDPVKKELSTRDVVSRAIFKEVAEGRGSPHGGAYLDITHKPADFIKNKLPSMYHQYMDFAGVDITKEKMEVAPTAHYFMGGVRVNAETAEATVPGLYAAGETASGLHGANRMGGNSVADLLVFGKMAGEHAAEAARGMEFAPVDEAEVEAEIARLEKPFELGSGGENPFTILHELRDVMWDEVGLFRNGEGLKRALDAILALEARAGRCGVIGDKLFNPGWVMAVHIQGMLAVAEAMVRSAIERTESRGAHTRLDFPNKDEALGKVNLITRRENGTMKVTRSPVPPMPPEMKALCDRVYKQPPPAPAPTTPPPATGTGKGKKGGKTQ